MENLYASIPQVGKLLEREEISRWFPRIGRPLTTAQVSAVLAELRAELSEGGSLPKEAVILERIASVCRRTSRRRVSKVLNATGIILHTNMGRAPLSPAVWDAVREANTGYSNLEFDLETGKRGNRGGLVADLICHLTKGEAALVVNNNAAALLLLLTALAKDREVVISRGEQIQIGGGFRIPEILALSGARLVEVGTTNITTLRDYLEAITENTALVLVVHPSNFKIKGFASKPSIREFKGRLPTGVTLAVDQGSGITTERIPGETGVRLHLEDGADLVCFSADKILGGPQAGILVGRADLLRKLSVHPLLRAFRVGKTVLTLLEETLIRKLNGPEPGYAEGVYSRSLEELRKFGCHILKGIPKELADLVPATATTGGGSAPEEYFRSLAVEIRCDRNPGEILEVLRNLPLPIVAVALEGRVLLNLSTLFLEDAEYIHRSLMEVLGLSSPEVDD